MKWWKSLICLFFSIFFFWIFSHFFCEFMWNLWIDRKFQRFDILNWGYETRKNVNGENCFDGEHDCDWHEVKNVSNKQAGGVLNKTQRKPHEKSNSRHTKREEKKTGKFNKLSVFNDFLSIEDDARYIFCVPSCVRHCLPLNRIDLDVQTDWKMCTKKKQAFRGKQAKMTARLTRSMQR